MDIPINYIRRTSSTVPFGYKESEEYVGYLEPIENELSILKEVVESNCTAREMIGESLFVAQLSHALWSPSFGYSHSPPQVTLLASTLHTPR